MTKKGQGKPKREATKRQLARWQRQKKRQRLLFLVGVLVIAVALVTVGVGWYITQYRPLNQTVITVNGVSFDMRDYVSMLEYYGRGQSPAYLYGLVDLVAITIEENELIRQGAEKLGITVSDAEVDEELKSRDPPLSKDYRDVVRVEMLIDKLKDGYFEHQVPLSTEQVHLLAMFLESESQATEVRARLEAGEDFAELAGELSLEAITESKNGDLGWRPEEVLAELLETSVPVEYAFNSEVGVLSPPLYDETRAKSVGYWLIKVSERAEDLSEASIHVILLGSEKEAQDVRMRLEAGEDFATLAGELSQHEASKENGGDLGSISSGTMSSAVNKFVFGPELELNTLSEPIRDDSVESTGGYWLVKVLGKDDLREIADDDRELLKAKAFQAWVAELSKDPENETEIYLNDEQKAWAIAKITGG